MRLKGSLGTASGTMFLKRRRGLKKEIIPDDYCRYLAEQNELIKAKQKVTIIPEHLWRMNLPKEQTA